MTTERVAIPGSDRPPMTTVTALEAPNPKDLVSVTVMVRHRTPNLPPPGSKIISRDEYAEHYGADRADVAKVVQFAADFDLTMGDVSLVRRSIVLIGTVANMNKAFGTQLQMMASESGVFRGRSGQLFVPADLGETITGVFGLDQRPQAKTHFRMRDDDAGVLAVGDTSYTPAQVAQLYGFPAKGNGKGQTIAIIELGGGFSKADLTAYFGKLGISPVPSVTAVSIDGAPNLPVGDPNSADGEVLLDIEVIGAIAPGAKIVIYFAPNTDQGFLDAITTAAHDSLRKPSVISISWGAAESAWTDQALRNFDHAFQEAGLVGVTVCCASGDDGSSDGETDGKAHVDFPSSSPNVLACGGTRLESAAGKISSEVVWNHGPGKGAGGGGVSEKFPLPSYQAKVHVPLSVNPPNFKGRGVPDICGDADPNTGYQIHVDGKDGVFGGTSAVSPLWAALTALMNEQNRKPLGFLNPKLYAHGHGKSGLNDIVTGDIGAYKAGPGWDACSGLGSPNGSRLLAVVSED